MIQITWLKKTRGKYPSPIITEVRILDTNPKFQIPNPIPTSRVGAVTWKITSSDLVWEPWASFPGRWRSRIITLGQPTEIAVNQPSWLIHWVPSLTHRFQQSSLTRAPSVPKRTWGWTISKGRLFTGISVRNWGIRVSTKQTCTRYTTLL